MTTSNQNQAAKTPKAYNLHTVGVGFVNRLRFVKPDGKGKGYWAIAIGALYGVENDNGRAESSPYDLRVVGGKAIESVKALQAAFDEGKKIFVEFKAGDTRPEAFQYKRGAREGEWSACIKGSLLQLRKAWVNGELVIDTTAQPDEPEQAPVDVATEPVPVVNQAAPQAPEQPSQVVPDWRERLAKRPERITLLVSDPELNQKVWAIDALGCYIKGVSDNESLLLFTRVKPVDQVA